MKSASAKSNDADILARVREEATRRRRLKQQGGYDPATGPGWLSFREFVDRVNPRYRWYRHCEMLAGVLQRVADGHIKRLLVFEPPRHGKTEAVSKLFSAYWLYRNSDKWVGLCSYGADLAYTMSRAARDNFIRAGGEIRSDAAAVKHWETTGRGGMWATGVGGPATGKGFGLGIIDDPLKNAEEAASETIRAKQLDWYRSTFYTREDPNKDGKPDGAIIVIQTRWNEADLSGQLLAEEAGDEDHERWHIVNFAAIAELEPQEFPATCTVEPDWRQPGEALCPERRPVEKLHRIRDRIGGYYFAALYQQRPRPDEGTLFPSAWPIVEAVPINSDYVRYWDKAGTDDKGDYSAGVLMAQAPDGRYFIADVVRGRWSAATREAVILQTAKFDGRNISVRVEQEPGSSGKESGENTVRMLAGWDAKAETVTGDKITRARPFAAQAEVGNVSLIKGDWNRAFVDELRSFPHGAHDDQVDAASGAFNKLSLMPRSLGITGAVRVPVERRLPPGPRPLDTRSSVTYDQWNDKDRGFSAPEDQNLSEIAEVHDRHFGSVPKRKFYGR